MFSMKFAYEKLLRWTGNSQWWVVCGAIMLEPLMDASARFLFWNMNEGKSSEDLIQSAQKRQEASASAEVTLVE